MQHCCDCLDIFLEQSQSVRIRNHENGRIGAELALQIVEIDEAIRAALHRDGLKTGEGSGRGIGAVGAVRHQHFAAMRFPLVSEIRRGDKESRKFALGAGRRLQRHRRQTADFRKIFLHSVNAIRACPGTSRRLEADAGPRSRATRRAVRGAWGCTSWYTTPTGKNSCRWTCSAC